MNKKIFKMFGIALLFVFLAVGSVNAEDYTVQENQAQVTSLQPLRADANAPTLFSDMTPDNWAYPYVSYLVEHGVVYGYPDGTYRPDDYVTRAEFCSMAVRALKLLGRPLEQVYEYMDLTPEHWAYPYIQTAANFGLVAGTPDGYFLPNDQVKRVEVIAVITSALNIEDFTQEEALNLIKTYEDYNEIPEWAILRTAKAKDLDMIIIPPGDEKYLAPLRPATRGELAGFLVAMMQKAAVMPNEKIAEEKPEPPQPKIIADGYVLDNVYIDNDVAYIPAGTILPLAVMDCFSCKKPFDNSRTAKVGEPFSARATRNFVNKDKILVIPIGTRFEGKIRKVVKDRYFISNGKIVLTTDTIIKANTTDVKANFPSLADVDPRAPKDDFWSRFAYNVLKGRNVWVHKGQMKEFILSEPIKINVLTNWIE